MKAFFSDMHANHHPSEFFFWGRFMEFTPDPPNRADNIKSHLSDLDYDFQLAPDYGISPIAAVHTPAYIDYLQTAWAEWQKAGREELQGLGEPGKDVYPFLFNKRGMDYRYPTSIVGRSGWHAADMWMPLGENSWQAIQASANLAVAAAQCVVNGDRSAYALCRPSGHHAFSDQGGGNCYLNNAAIAAQSLLGSMKRVALIDIDVHHGNGTQGIFYDRADVFFTSLHCAPNDCYPIYAGYDAERGEGSGAGYNLNIPLPRLSGDEPYLIALDKACHAIQNYSPDALVVSLGVDGHEADMNQALAITTEGFRQIGEKLSSLNLPTVLVQEGGYNLDTIGPCVSAVLSSFSDRDG